VIAVDSNILVYAHRAEGSFHAVAARVMRQLATGKAPWAIPWTCLHEFLGVVTHPRIFKTPTPLRAALDQVDYWVDSPSLSLLAETDDYWRYLKRAIADGKVTGPMIHDARIAAICQSHGVSELWSADRDFSRFKGLAVRNPLI
jgi:uncharacterized protein